MCVKRGYSKLGALYALAAAQDKNNEYHPIRYYKCPKCKMYHLSSKPSFHESRLE